MKKNLTLAVTGLVFVLTSCQKQTESHDLHPVDQSSASVIRDQSSEQINIYKGPQVSVGNGKVRSWFKVNHLDQPIELGFEITEEALTGLPATVEEGQANPNWTIPLHEKAKELTPYDHLQLNWNPQGHPPAIFNLPHFDMHFYMITEEKRLAIPPYFPGSAFDNLPAPAYRPEGYITAPGEGVAQMGRHWIAPPILPPFSHVMIWGSYDGKMTFVEPMITLAFLQSGVEVSQTFGQPQLFPEPGNYPTAYAIRKSGDKHYVSLKQFFARP